MDNVNNLNIFKNKPVFITGHTGFKGSWLSFWLTELGAKVTGYALEPVQQDALFNKLFLKNSINHIIGDIRDDKKLLKSLQDTAPEFVFHLAAQSLVRKSYLEPQLTFATNVLGSVNLLEAVRQCSSVRSLVYITSDKCYVNKEWVWGYRENDELGGPDPYSASKACAEFAFKSYYLSYFKNRPNFGCGSTRAGNVIGGGDYSDDRIIPDVIRAVANNQSIKLRNPNATRPWQHVLDPLYGYIILAKKLYNQPELFNGESWNFGPSGNSIRTVSELVNKLSVILNLKKINANMDSNNFGMPEATLLHLSIDKSKNLLQWQPKLEFDAAVQRTGEWYKKIINGGNAIDVTKQQILDFMKQF